MHLLWQGRRRGGETIIKSEQLTLAGGAALAIQGLSLTWISALTLEMVKMALKVSESGNIYIFFYFVLQFVLWRKQNQIHGFSPAIHHLKAAFTPIQMAVPYQPLMVGLIPAQSQNLKSLKTEKKFGWKQVEQKKKSNILYQANFL